MIKAGIIGSTGYAGAELVRLLLNHPEAEIVWYGSRSYVGDPYADVYGNFFELVDESCLDDDLDTLAKRADVIFTATPQGFCASKMSEELLSETKVIDLSADFRIKNAERYEAWYGIHHPTPEFLREAVYGLPERHRKEIAGARLIANPGCYPTCSTLTVAPFIEGGFIDPDSVIIDAKSGTTGAGRGAKVQNLYCEVNENVKAYGVTVHRHTPEIEDQLGEAAGRELAVQFTPHLIPMNRGILVTAYAKLLDGVDEGKMRSFLTEKYRDEPFVRVLPEGKVPETRWVKGSNYADVGFKTDPRTRRVIMMGAIDNIGKGAAGQAVQNMNIMFGLDECGAAHGTGVGVTGKSYICDEEETDMDMITGGVTAAAGFSAAGCAAGIKKNGRTDMAMIFSEKPCSVAGTFTTNVVKAAPVLWDQEIVKGGRAQAVVVNAGVANACTGQTGLDYCKATAGEAGKALGIDPGYVLVGSTGVIGVQLPIDRICAGVRTLSGMLGPHTEDGLAAAKAIMTTDTLPKEAAVTVTYSDGTRASVGGCAKGSGMIHPNMCTMLSFITTDTAISSSLLQAALSSVIPETFNMVSVDGDTSTNDSCLVLANGMAGNAEITEENDDYKLFREALLSVCTTLAKMMAKDGEGATCLFECTVIHAKNIEEARILARSVVSSTLTKAAIAGHDANWGRILCALGYSGVDFSPERVTMRIESKAGELMPYVKGVPMPFDEEKATEILSQDEIRAIVDMEEGDASATAWGCDLTHEYVNINADYRS